MCLYSVIILNNPQLAVTAHVGREPSDLTHWIKWPPLVRENIVFQFILMKCVLNGSVVQSNDLIGTE